MSESTLFVVATPIGNLDDLSPRAREVLASVDLIAAEDTRVTRRLLSRFSIRSRQTALHEHNEKDKCAELIKRLQSGQSIALVSDAGTPLVSDPGFLLVRAAHEAGIDVVAVPGPSAAVAALSVSGGLPSIRDAIIDDIALARGHRLLRTGQRQVAKIYVLATPGPVVAEHFKRLKEENK